MAVHHLADLLPWRGQRGMNCLIGASLDQALRGDAKDFMGLVDGEGGNRVAEVVLARDRRARGRLDHELVVE